MVVIQGGRGCPVSAAWEEVEPAAGGGGELIVSDG